MMRNWLTLIALLIFAACSNDQKKERGFESAYPRGSFGYDLDFLRQKDSVIVLNSKDGNSQVIVSPKYQGKVFTSTADGLNGKSFGRINYKTFAASSLDAHMNAYGGEDRLWLGPEGGRFALFFKPGSKMDFANWHTPPAVDFENWTLTAHTDKMASLTKSTRLINYRGMLFMVVLLRDIQILEPGDVQKMLGLTPTEKVKIVAFKTTNAIINNGNMEWTKQTGAPCLWNLDMFTPSPQTTVIIPYKDNDTGKVVTTDYFGKIPEDRVQYNNGVLVFKADGKLRGKLGIPVNRAKNMAGSYYAQNKILTVTMFDIDPKSIYLNQEWKVTKDPFVGDAVNAYNDGPLADGSQMGPFYEIESVSPAAFLKPNTKLTHTHSVFHFIGNEDELNNIAMKVLGISLKSVHNTIK